MTGLPAQYDTTHVILSAAKNLCPFAWQRLRRRFRMTDLPAQDSTTHVILSEAKYLNNSPFLSKYRFILRPFCAIIKAWERYLPFRWSLPLVFSFESLFKFSKRREVMP